MLKVSNLPLAQGDGDTVVFLVRERENKVPNCSDKGVAEYLKLAHSLGGFRGQAGAHLVFYRHREKSGRRSARPERVIVVGLGKEPPTQELFREAGGAVAAAALECGGNRLRLAMPLKMPEVLPAEQVQALAEGLVLGSYRFLKYRKEPDPEQANRGIKEIVIHAEGEVAKAAVRRGLVAALAVNGARDMANEPGNHWTPVHFAKAGLELARQHALTCTVFDKTALKKMGMGGIVGVAQGSAQPPTLVALEYHEGTAKVPTILLVGKGLTFDAGGISLKPGTGMQDMKFDMSGGAAVLAVMRAVAELRPSGIRVVGLVPSAENLLGSAALKPGDIITQFNGKSVEVVNTDAEGRLLLADALAYGIKHYKPAVVVDIATLTGAVIIGLGHHRAGLMSNDDALAEKLLAIGEKCGEPLWRLPLDKEYRKLLKSEVADLRNVSHERAAGTITAAAFLQEFVGSTPWAHLDIAGTAWDFAKKSYVPKGPSGAGVRTLLELVLNWK